MTIIDGYKELVLEMQKQDYIHACNKRGSDINEHLPVLLDLANSCNSITEFGVREGESTSAFLYSGKKLRSYDIEISLTVAQKFKRAQEINQDVHLIKGNSLVVDIEPTDMLFIDSYHVYEQLFAELSKHHTRVRKYIAMHDTYTLGLGGPTTEPRGLLTAIIDFMILHPEWKFKAHYLNNYGMTVLERMYTLMEPYKSNT